MHPFNSEEKALNSTPEFACFAIKGIKSQLQEFLPHSLFLFVLVVAIGLHKVDLR